MRGIKYDGEKPKMHLLPPKALTEVAKVLTFGAQKYDEENWRKLDNLQSRYSSGALRHIFAHIDDEELDQESGLSHLAHAVCCLMFKLEIELENGKSKEEELRKPVGIEYSASYKPTQSYDWPGPDNEERSVPDFKYSIQYNPSEPSSGGL